MQDASLRTAVFSAALAAFLCRVGAPRLAQAQQVLANATTVTASGAVNTGVIASTAGYALSAVNGGVIQSFGPLTLITGGMNAIAVSANSRGQITLFDGSSVRVTGSGASGLLATGAGSAITATNTVVNVPNGGGGFAVEVMNGAVISLTGGAVTSVNSALRTQGGGTINATNVDVKATGANAIGVNANNGTINMKGGTITALVGAVDPGMNAGSSTSHVLADGTTLKATGDGVHVSNGGTGTFQNGSITAGAFGIDALSGGKATVTNSTITTSAIGLHAGDAGSIVTADHVSVNASGAGVDAVNAGTVNVSNSAVVSAGTGVQASSAGSVSVSNSSVATSVAGASAIVANGADSTVAASNATRITTSGDQASGAVATTGGTVNLLSGSSVATSGNNAPALFATGAASAIDAVSATISTSGAGSVGAWSTAGGAISFDTVSIASSGGGLQADGASSLGAINTTISTSGANAAGALANGGVVRLDGGSVVTSGASAPGLQAMAGSNALIVADGVTVNATGSGLVVGDGSAAIFRTGSIASAGTGVQVASAGSAMLADSVLATSGSGGIGLLVSDAGSSISASGMSIGTSGPAAHGVVAQNGGAVTLSDQNSIVTRGAGSIGLLADGAGSSVTDTGNLTIETVSGGVGVEANNGGAVSVQNVSVNVGGNHALASFGSNSTLSASGFDITTTGVDAFGTCACDTGTMQLQTGSIHTTGESSFGLYAGGPSVGLGQLNASNIDVTTNAVSAHGAAVSAGGRLMLDGGSVVTQGSQAFGLVAWGAGSLIANGSTVSTSGNEARGLAAMDGATAELHGVTLHTTGAASNALYSYAFGANRAVSLLVDGGALSADQSAAIRVSGASADITIQNGARITSGLNRLMDVLTLNGMPGQATLTANAETLNGDVFVDAAHGSRADITLQNGTVLTGAVVGASSMAIDPSKWNVTGSSIINGTLTNAGVVQFSSPLMASASGSDSIAAGTASTSTFLPDVPNGANDTALAPSLGSTGFKTLTVQNYVGIDAALGLNAQLGADASPSDKLVIARGTGSGDTSIGVTNVSGAGGLTVNDGIMVVQAINGATTTANAFALSSQIAAGAYTYYLFKGGVNAGTADDWYLRSSVAATPTPTPTPIAIPIAAAGTPPLPPPPPAGSPPTPLYRMEVPVYADVPIIARELNIAQIGTFHDRQGEQSLLSETGALPSTWKRIWGEQTTQRNSGTVDPEFSGAMGGIQIGQDVYADATSSGHRNHYGFFLGFARANGDVSGFALGFPGYAAGHLSIDSYSVGGYWTHIGPGGWYTDIVMTGSTLTIDPVSNEGIGATTHGHAMAASFEAGLPIPLAADVSVEPQAQLIWQHVSVNELNDGVSTVSFHGASGLIGRLGLRALGRFESVGVSWQPTMRADLWRYFGGTDSATFAGATVIPTSVQATSAQFGAGVIVRVGKHGSVYASGGYTTNVGGMHRRTVGGDAGMRWSW